MLQAANVPQVQTLLAVHSCAGRHGCCFCIKARHDALAMCSRGVSSTSCTALLQITAWRYQRCAMEHCQPACQDALKACTQPQVHTQVWDSESPPVVAPCMQLQACGFSRPLQSVFRLVYWSQQPCPLPPSMMQADLTCACLTSSL